MADIQSYRDLHVWQLGMDLTVELYQLTRVFPKEEIYGLTSQIRRAASSIPANIAEGYARGKREYQQFLRYTQGSLTELESHLMIAQRIGILPVTKLTPLLRTTESLGRMLNKLQQSLGKQ
jgi:four helix bundle protein